mgnify:CR=1 FL=1
MNTPSLFEFVQQNALLVSLAFISGAGLFWPGLRRSGGGQKVNTTEATLLINRENARILDVRPGDEFAAGHLPESLHIPLDKLSERVGELQKFKEKPIIVCCASGMRASRACGELKKQGFTRLYHLTGGIESWRQAGLPLKKGER